MATQVTLGSGVIDSASGLKLRTNGSTEAVDISTGQVATLAQNPILTSGTANGVLYLNGSKVATSGSALTFDGTTFAVAASGATQTIIRPYTGGSYGAQYSGGVTPGNTNYYLAYNATETHLNAASFNSFEIGGTEGMRLTSTGLGIGTSSPATQFVVSNAGAQGIEFTGSNGSIQVYNRSTSAYGTMNLYGNTLYFRTGTSPAINATLDSSGNLGIGTSSPSCKLQVDNGAGARFYVGLSNNIYSQGYNHIWQSLSGTTTYATIDASGNLGLGVTPSAWGSGRPALEIGGSTTGTLAFNGAGKDGLIVLNAVRDATSWKYVNTGYASIAEQYNGTHAWYTAASGTAGNAITFTQAMTLTSNGNLLVGATSVPSASVAGFCATGSSSGNFTSSGSSTSAYNHWLFYNGNGIVGSISTSGSTTTYSTSSDYRLKNITGPIINSGAYIDSLNPVEGTWKADGSVFVGLIAHEVQEASRTQIATGVKDGEEMQSMDYSNSELIANMIAELKSLRQRVAELEAR